MALEADQGEREVEMEGKGVARGARFQVPPGNRVESRHGSIRVSTLGSAAAAAA